MLEKRRNRMKNSSLKEINKIGAFLLVLIIGASQIAFLSTGNARGTLSVSSVDLLNSNRFKVVFYGVCDNKNIGDKISVSKTTLALNGNEKYFEIEENVGKKKCVLEKNDSIYCYFKIKQNGKWIIINDNYVNGNKNVCRSRFDEQFNRLQSVLLEAFQKKEKKYDYKGLEIETLHGKRLQYEKYENDLSAIKYYFQNNKLTSIIKTSEVLGGNLKKNEGELNYEYMLDFEEFTGQFDESCFEVPQELKV